MSTKEHVSFIPIDYNPFAQTEMEAGVPVTEPQMEILTACIIGGEDANRSYNESNSLRLFGLLDQRALIEALQQLVNRHEALRASFSADGTYLLIGKPFKLTVEFQDISSVDEAGKENIIQQFLHHNALTSFNLQQGPLFRAALFRMANDLHHLTLTAHHIVCDGWSFGILLEELSQLYSAYVKGEEPQLPAAPSLLSFALEQKKFNQSKRYQEIEQYWINQYKTDIPVLELPVDFPRPAVRTYAGQRLDFTLQQETSKALKQLSAKAGCSFVTTMLAAFKFFIHKLSGQEKIVIGLPAAGQAATETYGLVGHCVNLLPLRSEIDVTMTFLDFLKKLRSEMLNAYDHQLFTFGSLLKKLPIRRDASRVPLVPVVFNIDAGMDNKVSFQGLTYERISNPKNFEGFELALNVNSSNHVHILEWSYNTQLFKPETIEGMMHAFLHILSSLIERPELSFHELSLKTKENLQNKLQIWNNTSFNYPREKALHLLIAERAEIFADKIAVTHHQKQITHRELNERSNQLAHILLQKGIMKGDKVALALDRSIEMVVALLAVLKTGAAYVPLDPFYPTERMNLILQDSSVKALFTSKKYTRLYNTEVKKIELEEVWDQLKQVSKEMPQVSVNGNDLAYVLYTSGSTGQPKGVEIEHHSLVNSLLSAQQTPGINQHDRLLAVIPICFDPAGLELYLPLLSGAEIIVADAEQTKDGHALIDLIDREQITIMMATPSTWRLMLDADWDKAFSNLKAICGGEPLSNRLADQLLSKCNQLWNMYGPTEASILATIKKVEANNPITIGRPINNTQVYILNEQLDHVEENTIGEIYISGDGVARGYANRPGLTKQVFINNPFIPGTRMYRTGDLGKFLSNGEIHYIGRIDHQVKIRGNRIELGEIEYQLSKQKDIHQAVVLAREVVPGTQSLTAYIVPAYQPIVSTAKEGSSAGANASTEQIRNWKESLKKNLPSYMLPTDYILIEKIPLTVNGKMDREALLNITIKEQDERQDFITPCSEMEQTVAKVWTTVLGRENISINDDFFDIGGHSLLAVQMIKQIEKQTGVNLPLATLYEYSTIEKLAGKLLDSKTFVNTDCLVPIKPTGKRTPVYFIHGAFGDVLYLRNLARYIHPEQPLYGIRPKGLDGNGEIKGTIEEIAAEYITIIKDHNRSSSFVLAGYCFGGFVAYEMAKQSQRLGNALKMLIIIDTFANQTLGYDSQASKPNFYIDKLLKRKLFDLTVLLKDPKSKFAYEKLDLMKNLIQVKRKVLGPQNDHFYLSSKVESKCIAAVRKYSLTPSDVFIHLFRAEKRLRYEPDTNFLGWQPYALKGIKTYDVPGIHNEIFSEPHVVETAHKLQSCLDSNATAYVEETNKLALGYMV